MRICGIFMVMLNWLVSVEVSKIVEGCSDVGFSDFELALDGSDCEAAPFFGVPSIPSESFGCVPFAVSDVDKTIKSCWGIIVCSASGEDFVESFESVVSGHGSWLVWGCLSR